MIGLGIENLKYKEMIGLSKRIEYIDLMKGLCIFLVILLHCDFRFNKELDVINNCLGTLRMPLYFFLSGFFFKTYSNFLDFILRKVNNLVIPYVFFLTMFIIPYWILMQPISSLTELLLYYIEPFYPALWFLRCLFFLNIFYYVMYKYIDKKYLILSTFIISIFSFYLANYLKEFDDNTYVFWFLYISNIIPALFALPLVSIANYIKQKNDFFQRMSIKGKLFMTFFLIFLWGGCSEENIGFSMCNFGSNPYSLYIASLSGILTVYLLSSIVNKIPYFSYIGRYSLIVLGTHMIPILVINKYLGYTSLIVALITLIVIPVFIYFYKKYFPYFTAQKALFVYNCNRVKFAWKKGV